MLEAVAVVAMVAAVLCVAYAAPFRFARVRRLPRLVPRDTGGYDTGVALVVALLLLVLAGGAAAVADKVATPANEDSKPALALPPATSVTEKDLAAFSSVDKIFGGKLDQDLCVVRYYELGVPPAGKWWTTCEQARSLKTVRNVRRTLAAKREWSTYDGAVTYTIPKGTIVSYVRGRAADQCPPRAQRCLYRGGGVQLFFPGSLAPDNDAARRCASPAAAMASTQKAADDAKYGPCK
jgi:hypothetical protein